jgi:Fe-S oxidoreductase
MALRQMIFIPLFSVATLLFLQGAWQRLSLVARGKPVDRCNRPVARLTGMFEYAFAQVRVIQRPYGIVHLLLFWSFLVLLLANGEFILNGLIPSISLAQLPPPLYPGLFTLFDVVSLLTLLCVAAAFIRRFFAAPDYLETSYTKARSGEALFILGLIMLLMVAFFCLSAAEISLGMRPGGSMPLSSLLAGLLAGQSRESLHALAAGAWWLHAASLLTFLLVLPRSKHMHILTAIPNCFFRSLEPLNTQPRETFAPGCRYGAGQVSELSWKDLLDGFACTECGRCQDVCPARATGKVLNPRQVVHDIKVNLLQAGGAGQPLIGIGGEGSVAPQAIWDCTSCGHCMAVCPVLIEHLPKIVELRRHLVEMQADFPEELLNLFENMEQRSNPWGIAPTERSKWTSLLPAQPFVAGATEYLFYVGCAGSFDNRNKQVTLAVAMLLDKAGLSWGILGKEELCCGDSARRLGNEYLFEQMATKNVELFKAKGVVKIITQCPHCFSTFKNDYRQYGLELQVQHHSELLAELLAAGKLPLQVAPAGTTLLHDSCYLGRHNEVYAPPRAVIAAATGSAASEFSRHGQNAFCCGAGGGRMWMEEDPASRINMARVQEALTHHPATICVACPYCMTMFEDGLKDAGSPEVRVKDIAELLAERL